MIIVVVIQPWLVMRPLQAVTGSSLSLQ
jgi:hypothetical protein